MLGLLQMAFTVWMLVDCIRSNVSGYWVWLILWFQPMGSWVYFFTFKIHDRDTAWLRAWFHRPPSLESLQHKVDENPCADNHLKLAEALLERGEHDRAAELFKQVLHFDDESKPALLGLAMCERAVDRCDQAIELLERLAKRDRSYRGHVAVVELAANYWQSGRKSRAIELLEALVKEHRRFEHITILADRLAEVGERMRATEMLNKALDDYRHSPHFAQRAHRRWAKDARSKVKVYSAST